MELTAKNVESVFSKCLAKTENEPEGIQVEGVEHDFVFSKSEIEKEKNKIAEMLMCLPNEFMQDQGGGYSFLKACYDKNGNQWGDHLQIEKLFALGIAAEKVKCLLPREMWGVLPGGMPYYVVLGISGEIINQWRGK